MPVTETNMMPTELEGEEVEVDVTYNSDDDMDRGRHRSQITRKITYQKIGYFS